MNETDLDRRLDQLARATCGLRARPGFSERVMLKLGVAAPAGWLWSVARMAKAALAAATLASVAALFWAMESEKAQTEASAVALAALDLEW